jgi:acetylornithine deacetylase/succinyl-diaminopimelate desuccinylase-like protein
LAAERSAFERETVERLQALLSFDTTNPPGNELALARYLHHALRSEGIESNLFEPVPGRGAVIARIRGTGRLRPVMLMAHMDVVPVERDKWSCDPFAGIVRDGYVYGRGAIDDKGMLACNLMAMLELKRTVIDRGVTLDRDVIFLATSDEETGGKDGIKWVMREHAGLVDAEFAINEGGRTRILEGGERYLAIQTAEKISHMVTITARGPAGHAAIPLGGNAVFRLGRALAKLAAYREPLTLTATTRRFFERLSGMWPNTAEREAMVSLVSGAAELSRKGESVLSGIPVLDAVMRNGISPVRVDGGIGGNVIPAEVHATLNVRTIPGEDITAVAARIRAALDDEGLEVEITVRGEDAPASDPDSPMFDALASAALDLDPEMTVAPYMSTGGTDSAHLRRAGIHSYGILPFPMRPDDEERMHGHDERVPVASLNFGARLIFEAVRRIAQPATA